MKDNLVFGVLMAALFLGIVGSSLVHGVRFPVVAEAAQRYAQTLRQVEPAKRQSDHIVAAASVGGPGHSSPSAP
ncbi:MAG: hypothetical protein IT516_07775 [Burkholderiales bacterium]|nr:hypothetical protein [Burkholderiales bacterium]